jgi:Ni/Co efflux regulator RcnB
MKTSAIVCAVLAGTFGLSSIASAQGWNGDRGDRDHDRGQRFEQRQDHREARPDRQRWYGASAQPRSFGNQPRYVYEQPRYYGQPQRYAYAQPRFYRGGYLPYEYRTRPYYVSNWNAYPGLYAPPYGYQWMNVDGQFLLVALATGLIANALVNGY